MTTQAAGLGATIRAWRDRLSPAATGLTAGQAGSAGHARRAAGLRREELAELAGVSVDYIVRLEQGRAITPSAQVTSSLARALQLTSDEREQLAVAWLAGMKAGDAVAVAALFTVSEATTVIGNGADQWFTGDAYTRQRLDDSLGAHGGIPFEPGSPVGWAADEVGWFADQVTIVFPATTIPLRMTGVAIRQDGTWRLVQLHVSAAVSDEDLLAR